MKAAWCKEMMWGRMVESLLATVFVMILKEKFRRLIGLRSWKDVGDEDLGIKARRKVDEALRSLPEPKKFWTAVTTS